ncbi:E3 ubq [Acrasis kona]|uniref:RBR-type E3 ubiquitin transferase n=1 Tax=Acrasis kona TaxID=1008807 RepID=A0AAW2YP03_9EUKA
MQTKEEVGEWIASEVGLPQYRSSFVDNEITYPILLNLNTQDLKDMDITIIGHRKKIEMAIQNLKQPVHTKRNISHVVPTTQPSKKLKQSPLPAEALEISDEFKSLLLTGFPGVCMICMEEVDDLYPLMGCKGETHYCVSCLQTYLKTAIDSKKVPIRCPDVECRHEIHPTNINALLKRNEINKFERAGLENLVSPAGVDMSGKVVDDFPDIYKFLHCPTPNCTYIFAVDPTDEESVHLRCEVCKEHYCLKCKVKYHKGKTCIQHKRDRLNSGLMEQVLLMEYLKTNNVKMCPQCKKFIERSSGCQHMTCLCGHEFCFLCGKTDCECKEDAIDRDYRENSQE